MCKTIPKSHQLSKSEVNRESRIRTGRGKGGGDNQTTSQSLFILLDTSFEDLGAGMGWGSSIRTDWLIDSLCLGSALM